MGKQLKQMQATSDIPWLVAQGLVDDASSIDKFGHNPSVGTSYETVWDAGGEYAYPSSALAMTVSSSAGATDNGVEVTVVGLDADYEELTETVELTGTGTATTTGEFLRVFRAYTSNGQDATDTVTIANGGVTYAQYTSEMQQTLMAVYTIPAHKRGYLVSGNLSSTKDKDITAKLMMREFGGALRVKGLVLTPGTPFQRSWSIPQAIPEKTDIEIRARAGATGPVAAGFEIVLVDA